ncbi:uncharacterized protein LOC142344320 [Convolutriloba macropyga]|uniref:uncharacterized protein LOC142344320 n=1 Tax=Convolutriloba macropyga TaxID=536237 RepID=UPI003F5218DF
MAIKQTHKKSFAQLEIYLQHPRTEDPDWRCCSYQRFQYLDRVWPKGYSPEDYLEKLADYRNEDKRLIAVSAQYNQSLCLNIILAVNFGSIDPNENILLMSDAEEGAPYVMAPQDGTSEVYMFGVNSRELRHKLTFDWFKRNYICKEHPEHCE